MKQSPPFDIQFDKVDLRVLSALLHKM